MSASRLGQGPGMMGEPGAELDSWGSAVRSPDQGHELGSKVPALTAVPCYLKRAALCHLKLPLRTPKTAAFFWRLVPFLQSFQPHQAVKPFGAWCLTSCVTLDQTLSPVKPQFPLSSCGKNNNTCSHQGMEGVQGEVHGQVILGPGRA